MMWFLQIAQLSTTISQAHRATAFHCDMVSRLNISHPAVRLTFLTSNRFLPSPPSALALPTAFLTGAVDVEGASVISTSAMVFLVLLEGERLEMMGSGGVMGKALTPG
jgi:hypothetical protein